MAKKLLSWLLLLFGEALIIAAFIVFRGETADNIFILNIIVSSVIYASFFVDILVPWVDFNDKSQKQIGSLGLRWFFVFFYALFAIATMICSGIYNLPFATQLIIHGILFFLFLLGLLSAIHSRDKVEQVYEKETENRSRIIEMKDAMRNLKDRMNHIDGLPGAFKRKIDTLEEDLRFISPSNNREAHELETSFVRIINDIGFAVSDFSMNQEKIEGDLKNLERIYQNRKNIYSK